MDISHRNRLGQQAHHGLAFDLEHETAHVATCHGPGTTLVARLVDGHNDYKKDGTLRYILFRAEEA
jgi:hypothetical protein